MSDPEFANPGGFPGSAPDEEPRRHERERDDAVELNDRERDEDQEATPAALFI